MEERTPTRGALHATLREVESGVYQAEYKGEMNPESPADERAFPDMHVGTDRDGVRMWVEEMARAMGYERVEWEHG